MRKNKKKTVSKFILGIVIFLLLYPRMAVLASAKEEIQKKQMIFLLDASKSMEIDGKWDAAVDSVFLIDAALPQNYETALLVYNTDILYSCDFGEMDSQDRIQLEHLKMQGYTNPKIALEKAMQQFGENAAEKRVVFLSDGEISMKDEELTRESIDSYADCVESAAEGDIWIDMLVIPDEKTENLIVDGAKRTGGTVLAKQQGKHVEEMAASYLFETLHIDRLELGISHTDGGNIPVELQESHIQNAKILLVAENAIEQVQVLGQCEEWKITEGERYAVIELKNPLETQIGVEYTLEKKGKVHAYLTKEYAFEVRMQNAYTSETGKFDIAVEVLDHQGKRIFDAKNLTAGVGISIDGNRKKFDLKEGKAILPYETAATKEIEVAVDFADINGVVYCDASSRIIKLNVPIAEEEPDYKVLWIVLAVLGGVILLLVICYQWNKQKKNFNEAQKKKEPDKKNSFIGYDFSGQIAVYVLKSREEDIPPCRIKLFGMGKKPCTFERIKEQCGIGYDLADADKLKFCGGKDHALCLKNTGNATVVKGNEVLLRNKKYDFSYGEKMLLIFNDGETEIELHYKNIKPSER